jgi:hypothetical protein
MYQSGFLTFTQDVNRFFIFDLTGASCLNLEQRQLVEV